MRKVTLSGLLARKLRLALTALAIVLGVTFVTGTLVLGDTLNRTFNNLVGTAYQHVSFQIRGKAVLQRERARSRPGHGRPQAGPGVDRGRRQPRPGCRVRTRLGPGLRAVPGPRRQRDRRAAADRRWASRSIPTRNCPPTGWSRDKAPTTADDVVMDKATATKHHYSVGDRVLINLPNRPQTFTITGIVTFGSDNNLAGVTLAGFDLHGRAEQLFDSRGYYDTINVLAAPGADNVKLQRAIARLLPPGVEVVSGQTVANELSSAVDNELGFISTALLIFAFDLAVRRRLHDLQHVLDHRRPANPRARAAARRRREPAPGVPLGASARPR